MRTFQVTAHTHTAESPSSHLSWVVSCFHSWHINLTTFCADQTFVIPFFKILTSQGVIKSPTYLAPQLLRDWGSVWIWKSSQHIFSHQEEHFLFINYPSILKPHWDIASTILIKLDCKSCKSIHIPNIEGDSLILMCQEETDNQTKSM